MAAALLQLRAARRTREEQAQPYVAVSLEGSEAGQEFLELVIKNYGQTAAHNLRVTFEPPLQRTSDDDPSGLEEVIVPDVFPVLVPGQEWRTFWDTLTTLTRRRNPEGKPFREIVVPDDAKLPADRYTATVKFDDSQGRPLGPYRFVLDWTVEFSKGAIVIYAQHHQAKAIRELAKDIHKVIDSGNLRVHARDGDARDERARKRREEQSPPAQFPTPPQG